ncbi:MAG: hypothetical protein JNJ83_23820 [Verrucomicrobiaceae bacterium]|nr:hypothetical protein [Verrucomicrobiaceae bacterium]
MTPSTTTTLLKPSEEALIVFLQTEWQDVHHSRIQEWSALGVVTGTHFAMVQLPSMLEKLKLEGGDWSAVVMIGCAVSFIMAVLGMLITCRHRNLMEVKLSRIFEAERQLGLVKSDTNPMGILNAEDKMLSASKARGLSLPRPLSTSGMIFSFYLVLVLFDVMCLLFAMKGGKS